MKKLLCGILAGTVLALSCAGCGSSDSNKDTDNSGVTGEITVVSREDGSGTRSAFTELLGILDDRENDATTETAEITNSTSVMITTVEGNKNAIGYVSLGSLSDTVKEVKVDDVEGNAENVKNGTYKISRPFNLAYYDGKLSKVAQDFVDFIMSSDGQEIVDKEGYISVEEGTPYKSSGISGKVTLAGSTSVAPLMNVIADEYKKLNPDVSVEIQESGSSAGIQSAIKKAVDIGMSSRELKDDEAKSLVTKQIAMDGIAVVVNKENTIENLTSDQIKSIYLGETTTWDEVK